MKRDLSNKILFGVCAGLAKELGVEVVFIRIAFAALTLCGFGLPVLFYLLATVLTPAE